MIGEFLNWVGEKVMAVIDKAPVLPTASEEEVQKQKDYFEEAARQLEERKRKTEDGPG